MVARSFIWTPVTHSAVEVARSSNRPNMQRSPEASLGIQEHSFNGLLPSKNSEAGFDISNMELHTSSVRCSLHGHTAYRARDTPSDVSLFVLFCASKQRVFHGVTDHIIFLD